MPLGTSMQIETHGGIKLRGGYDHQVIGKIH